MQSLKSKPFKKTSYEGSSSLEDRFSLKLSNEARRDENKAILEAYKGEMLVVDILDAENKKKYECVFIKTFYSLCSKRYFWQNISIFNKKRMFLANPINSNYFNFKVGQLAPPPKVGLPSYPPKISCIDVTKPLNANKLSKIIQSNPHSVLKKVRSGEVVFCDRFDRVFKYEDGFFNLVDF